MHLQLCRRPKRAMLNPGNCASACASLHAHNVTFTDAAASGCYVYLIMSDIFRVPLQRDDEESKVKDESVKDSKTV